MSEVTLAVIAGAETGREIPLTETITVGRDPDRANLPIDDPEISSSHASFYVGDTGPAVQDNGSTNGTFVNGQLLNGPHLLANRDQVKIGATVFEVRAAAVQAEAAPPPQAAQETLGRPIPTPPVIVFLSGEYAGSELPVSGPIVVGRDAVADVVLTQDSEISRRHATFSPAGGGLTVQDLGSTNGTNVNGYRIDGAVTLSTGDRVDVGQTAIEVRLPAAPPVEQLAAPAAAQATNSIEVEGLVREFKNGPRAVDGIDLHVNPGEIFGFLGPNGAGKSTTVHMLTTLLPPSGGVARVAGYDVGSQGPQVRSAIGVALQDAALDPALNAWEHMALQTALQGIPKRERADRAAELIERVGITYAADRRVGGYSGGMKRRLDLALALVHRPQVLFLDEPTTGLDPQSRTALWEEVNKLARGEGMTVFLTTQYLEEADLLADHIAIIDHGEIVARGTPDQLKAEIGRPTVEAIPLNQSDWAPIAEVLQRFGELSTAAHKGVAVRLNQGVDGLADIVRALDGAGLRVANLDLHSPTLDDVFLAKTGRPLEGAGEEELEGRDELAEYGQPAAPQPYAG